MRVCVNGNVYFFSSSQHSSTPRGLTSWFSWYPLNCPVPEVANNSKRSFLVSAYEARFCRRNSSLVRENVFQPVIFKLMPMAVRPDSCHEVFNLLAFCRHGEWSSPHIRQLFWDKIIMCYRHHARHQAQFMFFG